MKLNKIFRCLFGQTCLFCGKAMQISDQEYLCPECSEAMRKMRLELDPHAFPENVALYRFESPIKQGLYRFKYGGERRLGILFGEALAERYRILEHQADLVTCVPRAKDGRRRMYNQSEVIAKAMAKGLDLPTDFNLLSKRKGARSQVECPTRYAREENAKWAYRKGKSKIDLAGKRVVLVDDLYTSGATARACCDLLKKQGAEEILVYTALRVAPLQTFSLRVNYQRTVIHEAFHQEKKE